MELDPFENSALLLDESTIIGPSSTSMGDQTNSEAFSLDQSELMNSTIADDVTNGSSADNSMRSLRSSKRRVLKHSSVVLNADKLKRVIDKVDGATENATEVDVGDTIEDLTDLTIQDSSHDRSEDSITQVQPGGNTGVSLASTPAPSTPTNQSKQKKDQTTKVRVMNMEQAAWIISRCWKRRRSERLFRFTQGRKWSRTTAIKVFSLFLGYRTRRLFRQYDVKKAVAAQRDMERVLLDLLNQQTESTYDTSLTGPDGKLKVFWLPTVRSIIATRRFFATADAVLAKSLLKELVVQKEKLIKFIFLDCQWISCSLLYPATGYWNLISTRAINRKTSQIFSPPRGTSDKVPLNEQQHGKREKIIPETPPHVKHAVERSRQVGEQLKKVPVRLNLGKNPHPIIDSIAEDAISSPPPLASESSFIQSGSEADSDRNRPTSLKDILASKQNNNTAVEASEYFDDRPITPSTGYNIGLGGGIPSLNIVKSKSLKAKAAKASASAGGDHSTVPNIAVAGSLQAKLASHSSAKLRKDTNNTSSSGTVASASTGPLISTRHRTGDGGHIQLDILSGERLIPAKKGAVTNKESGVGLVPDRKPGLKITLNLPSTSSNEKSVAGPSNARAASNVGTAASSSSGMKKAFHAVKDFDELTFNPQWDATFEIPLPVPKTILKATAEQEDIQVEPSTEIVTLSEDQYMALCKSLLNFWSGGNILIEVCDNERFNEEIFMGQVVILITSFMPLIKKHHELEIKGSFTLEKQKPTNRVSGSIRLHAYLHVPLKSYLEILIRPFVLAVIASSRVSHNRLDGKQQHSTLAKEQAASDRRRSTSRSRTRPPGSVLHSGNPLYHASTGAPFESDTNDEDALYQSSVQAQSHAYSHYNSDNNYDSGFDSGHRSSRSVSRNRGRPLANINTHINSQKTSPSQEVSHFPTAVATDLSLHDSFLSSSDVANTTDARISAMEKPKYFSKFMQSLATSLEEIDNMLNSNKVDSRRLRHALLQQENSQEENEEEEVRAVKQRSQLQANKPAKTAPAGHEELLSLATLHEPNLEESENIKLPLPLPLPLNLPAGKKRAVPPPPPPPTPPPTNKFTSSPSPPESGSSAIRSAPSSAAAKNPFLDVVSPVPTVTNKANTPSSATPPPPPPPSQPPSVSNVSPLPTDASDTGFHGGAGTPGISPRVSRLPRYSLSKGQHQSSPNQGDDEVNSQPQQHANHFFADDDAMRTPIASSKPTTPAPVGSANGGSGNKSSLQKRMFIDDMYKQLDSITAMQQSTEEAVDNWSKRLEARRKEKSMEGSRIPVPVSAVPIHDRLRSPGGVDRLPTDNIRTPMANSSPPQAATQSSPEAPSSSSSQRLAAKFEDQDATILVESEEETMGDYEHYGNDHHHSHSNEDHDAVNGDEMDDEEDFRQDEQDEEDFEDDIDVDEENGDMDVDTEEMEELDDIHDTEGVNDDDLLDTDGLDTADYLSDGDIPFERKAAHLHLDGDDNDDENASAGGESEVMIIPSPVAHKPSVGPEQNKSIKHHSSPKHSPISRRHPSHNIIDSDEEYQDDGNGRSGHDLYYQDKVAGNKSTHSPTSHGHRSSGHLNSPSGRGYVKKSIPFRNSGEKFSLPHQRQSAGLDGISSDEDDVYENDFHKHDDDHDNVESEEAPAPINVMSMRQQKVPLVPVANKGGSATKAAPALKLPSSSPAFRLNQYEKAASYGSDGLYSDSNNESDSYSGAISHSSVAQIKKTPMPLPPSSSAPSIASHEKHGSAHTPSRIPRSTILSSSPRTQSRQSVTDSGEEVSTPTGRRFFPSSPKSSTSGVPKAAPLHLIDSDEDEDDDGVVQHAHAEVRSKPSIPTANYRKPGREPAGPSPADVANARRAATSASAKIAVKRAIIELGDLDML